jgi:hypothetical protein
MYVDLLATRDRISPWGRKFYAGRVYPGIPRGQAHEMIRRKQAVEVIPDVEVQPAPQQRASKRANNSR